MLAHLAEELSESDWNKPVVGDGRTIGIVIHHIASVYPVEIELAQRLAAGNPITEATKEVIDQMNAKHARAFANVRKPQTLTLLRHNSKMAAGSIMAFSDNELDTAAKVSLNANAPLTVQFFIKDHALRHSFQHLATIKASL